MSKEEQKMPTMQEVLATLMDTNSRLVARLEAIEGGNTAQAAHDRYKEMIRPLAPEPVVVKDCISTFTGAMWDAVMKSDGKTVSRLENVRLPKGWDKHQKHGGLVPDSIPIFRDNKSVSLPKNDQGLDESLLFDRSILSWPYRSWLRETLWMPDLLNVVGKPLAPHHMPKAS